MLPACLPRSLPPPVGSAPSVGWGDDERSMGTERRRAVPPSFARHHARGTPFTHSLTHPPHPRPAQPSIHSLSCRYKKGQSNNDRTNERANERAHQVNGAHWSVGGSRQRARWRWRSKVGANLRELPPSSSKTFPRRSIDRSPAALALATQQTFSAIFSHAPDLGGCSGGGRPGGGDDLLPRGRPR